MNYTVLGKKSNYTVLKCKKNYTVLEEKKELHRTKSVLGITHFAGSGFGISLTPPTHFGAG